MAPSAPVSRKAKRKNEREEKKRSHHIKRQRRPDEPAPVAAARTPAAPGRARDVNRKRPPQPKARIQNKFHELLQETIGHSGRSTKATPSREDAEIKALETKLGLSSTKGSGINKLKKEYARDGLGEDFVDFLTDLDSISQIVKERKPSSPSREDEQLNDDESEDEESEDDGDERVGNSEDDPFGGMEMDDETRKELALLQAEDADFLQGMDELPTDESDEDSEADLAAFDTEDEDDDDEADDEVMENTLRNQQRSQQTGGGRDDDDASEEDDSEADEDDEEADGDERSDKDDEEAEDSDHDDQRSEEKETEAPVVVGEDIYGRPVVKTADGAKPSAYVPPHLRRKLQEEAGKTAASAGGVSVSASAHPLQMDDQALRELTRRLNGQLNRISEANMESIALEVEKIYREYPRSVVNGMLLDKILQIACHPGIVMAPMIRVCGALVAALYHSVGSEVGGYFVEKIVLQLVASVKRAVDEATASLAAADEDSTTSKEPVNLLLLVAMLYNFGVVQCQLVYDLFRSFLDGFSGVELELIHQILRASGHQLRTDDADALRDMIASVQQKVAALTQHSEQPAERVRFVLDLIYDLKKPSKHKKARLGAAGAGDADLSSLKKWIGRVKTRVGNANNPMRLSLHELLHADQDGRWWVVGGTWVGYQQAGASSEVSRKTTRDDDDRLLQLAEKQRMNTDVRRQIFVAIMGASDSVDAYERLLQLHLKEKQEREIVRVLLHCAGNEQQFNKFYLVLAAKLCEMDPRYKFTFQLAFWDAFKQLDVFSPRKLYNLAQLLAGLAIATALSLSVLKVLDFTALSDKTVLFLRVALERILRLETELEVAQVFERLLQTKKAQVTLDGLAVFLHQHLTSFRAEDDAAVRALLKKRSKHVRSLLDHLSKTAASAEHRKSFL